MINVSDIIHSFEDIIAFYSPTVISKINQEIYENTDNVQLLAKAIHDHANIQIKSSLSGSTIIIIGKQRVEMDDESLAAINKIVNKFKLNFEGMGKKLTSLYQRIQSTNDQKMLNSIKKDIVHLQQEIESHEKFSAKTRQALQDKCTHVLEEVEHTSQVLKTAEILKKGKSMQGYPGEVLPYEGYLLLESIKEKRLKKEETLSLAERTLLKAKGIHETSQAIKSVKKTLQEAQLGLLKGLSPAVLKEMAEAVGAGKASEEQVKLVVNCKRLWMDLATEEGSYLEIFHYINKEDFKGLEIIKEVAFMQGTQVDIMLSKAILEDHLKNKPVTGSPMRFLVEGAGPNGLYAALQFFRSGSSISVVNDRGERVMRNQNLILDAKWIAQLNFFLGSAFNELFIGPNAWGALNLQRGSGSINTKILEDVLKVRAAEVSSFIDDTHATGKDTFLNLQFEAPLKGIKSSEQGFSGIIGIAKESQDSKKFRKLAIEKLTKTILSTKYAEHKPEDIIDHRTVLSKAQEEAEVQWMEGQSKAKIEHPDAIPFDFLACIGGANDSIRDGYLAPAYPFTIPRSHAIATWVKPETDADKRYSSQENMKRLDVKADQLGFPYLTRSHVQEPLRSQEFDKIIASTDLPEDFRKKYANFTEELLKNIETTHLQYIEPDQHLFGFNIRTFENNYIVYLGASNPPFLSDFLHDLDKLIKNASISHEAELLKAFKREIDKKWMNAIAEVFSIDPSVVKLDEEFPINVGTFDVQQKRIDIAAKLLEFGKFSAGIMAFGDSRASPQFFSGSGMSTGRLGIEDGAKLLKQYNKGEIRSKKDFVKKLDLALGHMKEKVAEKGSRFMKPNTGAERMAVKCSIIKSKIKEYFDAQQRTKTDITKTGWKIESEVSERGVFDLSFIDQEKAKQTFKVEVSREDGLLHAHGKKYLVFNDLLLDLGVA
jgi:hypothetical protein